MGAVLVHIKVYNKVHNKVHNSYLASLERLLLISLRLNDCYLSRPMGSNDCYLSRPMGLNDYSQSFKVSRIRDACFTASLFQGFITHNSSPIRGAI